jgi:hypothetical protein
MARNKRFKLTRVTSKRASQDTFEVLDRKTGQRYAILYRQNHGGWRYRLDNYAHRMSALFATESSALDAIEREVF